jgi:GNAT superfamily N-acetyltransferase
VPYDIRRATPEDAEEYVACHVDCLAETYVEIMPPAFAELHRTEAPERVRRTREAWRAAAARPPSAGASWLARDASGEVVGVVQSGPGTQGWEVELGAPPTAVPYQLNHLYTRQRTYGTGLGRRLLDVALTDEATYLWILHGNARADRFYRRHGFAPNGDEMSCGASWFFRTMYRMVRPGQGASSTGPASIATRNSA